MIDKQPNPIHMPTGLNFGSDYGEVCGFTSRSSFSTTLLLFAANWMTRGSDGFWWIVAVLQVWVIAWALHLFGAGSIYATKRPEN